MLITDNVLQDGTISGSRYAIKRRDRTIHIRMREYLYQLKHTKGLETIIIPVGDGVALTTSERHEIIMKEYKKPELLLPASNLEVLKLAFSYGADAVYIGGEMYGLRAKAKNFSLEDMKEAISFAHERKKKVYVTANIIAHNEDLEGFREYFKELKEIQPDALIISDPIVLEIAKEIIPDMESILVHRLTM